MKRPAAPSAYFVGSFVLLISSSSSSCSWISSHSRCSERRRNNNAAAPSSHNNNDDAVTRRIASAAQARRMTIAPRTTTTSCTPSCCSHSQQRHQQQRWQLSLSSALYSSWNDDEKSSFEKEVAAAPDLAVVLGETTTILVADDDNNDNTPLPALSWTNNMEPSLLETADGTFGVKKNSDVTVSVILLNCVAVLWGSQHAVIKMVVTGDPSSSSSSNSGGSATSDVTAAAAFTLLRFGLVALLASPYTPGLDFLSFRNTQQKEQDGDNTATPTAVAAAVVEADTTTQVSQQQQQRQHDASLLSSNTNNNNKTTWRWGLEMGIWMFLGFGLQAVGLQSTTAQRSGFLLYLNVKFVPFLARILYGREIRPATLASAVTAFTGTALLAYTSTTAGGGEEHAALFAGLNAGDLWTIAAAAASAMFILRLERASMQVPDAAGLNAACLWVVTVLSAVWMVTAQLLRTANVAVDAVAVASLPPPPNFVLVDTPLWWSELCGIAVQHPLEIIYLGGVTTALANWIQTKAQRDVTAERASVIYAMDPVYGAIFSYCLLGETMNGVPGWIGAGLITVAAATNAFLDVSNTATGMAVVDEGLATEGRTYGGRNDTTSR